MVGLGCWESGRSLSLRDERGAGESGKAGASSEQPLGVAGGGGAGGWGVPGRVPVWAGCPRGGSVRPGLELPVVSSWHSGTRSKGQDHPRGREKRKNPKHKQTSGADLKFQSF